MSLFESTTSDYIVPLGTCSEPACPALVRFFPDYAVHPIPERARVTLGRSPRATVVLPLRRCSREHATLIAESGRFVLSDQDSRNGTFVRGQRLLGSSRLLRDGDVVRLGEALFVFRASLPPRRIADDVVAIDGPAPYGIVGPVHMPRVWRAIEDAARAGHRALVLGETGTGKDLVARAIAACARPGAPFVALNAAAIPRDLFESELFGHRRGAFSGATESRAGAFRRAHGGVLFLDEVGDLSPESQAKLLRVLETGEVQPVGADTTARVDVHVVAATERPLRDMVVDGRFRASLYNRLREVEIWLPPLRERIEDLPALVAHLLGKLGLPTSTASLDPETLEVLASDPCPGNVRELASVLAEAVRAREGEAPDARTLRAVLAARELAATGSSDLAPAEPPPDARTRAVPKEHEALLRALEEHDYNVRRTAEALGRPRSWVYRAIARASFDLRDARRRRRR